MTADAGGDSALDLAARFDYEHWLRSGIRKNPQLFNEEDVIEKLPADLRKDIAPAGAENPTPESVLAEVSESAEMVIDLTVKTFGFVEIYRDQTKQFAPDAWTTKRARDIFCYIATSKHRRAEKDLLIDIFNTKRN